MAGGISAGVCVGMGIPSMGTGSIVCGLVVAAAGSYGVGLGIGKFGESIGDIVYEMSQ